jgi:sarcosine oxidase
LIRVDSGRNPDEISETPMPDPMSDPMPEALKSPIGKTAGNRNAAKNEGNPMKSPDIVVAGLGTVGAATCMALARRGVAVLGLDRLRPPHESGSHHGETRSVRRAYLEGTAYVPMAQRAWELWEQLERDTGVSLLRPVGNLTIGPPDGPAVAGFLEAARSADIPHEVLDAARVRKRWPRLAVPDEFAAGLEIAAGIVRPEAAISAFLAEAEKAGADLRFDEPVQSWAETSGRVEVRTESGVHGAGRLLLAGGARNPALLGLAGRFLTPVRVPVHWIEPPHGTDFDPDHFPVNFWQIPDSGPDGRPGYREFYSLPAARPGARVKAAPHNRLEPCDPATSTATPLPGETERLRDLLRRFIPSLAERSMTGHICFYTLTPDGDFALGPVPGRNHVFTAALAGHGFKFAPVLGEILADRLQGNPSPWNIDRFSPDRFRVFGGER